MWYIKLSNNCDIWTWTWSLVFQNKKIICDICKFEVFEVETCLYECVCVCVYVRVLLWGSVHEWALVHIRLGFAFDWKQVFVLGLLALRTK